VVITGSWTGVRRVSAGSQAMVTIDDAVVLELSVGDPEPLNGRGTKDARG